VSLKKQAVGFSFFFAKSMENSTAC